MNKKNFKFYILCILLILLDQISKFLVRKNFSLYQTKQITSFLALTYITNTGIVFGFFEGFNLFFSIIIVVVLIVLLFSIKSIKNDLGENLGSFVISLIFCGGIGNLIDRIFLGKVVDFIDLQFNYKNIWPVFNFADSYVFVGVWLMVIKYFLNIIKKLKGKHRCFQFF